MKDLSELYLRRLGPVLTGKAVYACEKCFEVTLPPSYLHFLSLANGGEPMVDSTFSYTIMTGEYVEDADQVKWFGSLTDNLEDCREVWRNTIYLRSVFSSLGRDTRVIWIGETADGGLIYLDCATSPAPVYALYRECDDTTPKIASSFSDFLESLHPRR